MAVTNRYGGEEVTHTLVAESRTEAQRWMEAFWQHFYDMSECGGTLVWWHACPLRPHTDEHLLWQDLISMGFAILVDPSCSMTPIPVGSASGLTPIPAWQPPQKAPIPVEPCPRRTSILTEPLSQWHLHLGGPSRSMSPIPVGSTYGLTPISEWQLPREAPMPVVPLPGGPPS